MTTLLLPRKNRFVSIALSVLIAFGSAPQLAYAQDAQPEQAPSLPKEQLEQLVAPIALYPDSLLSQVLMASTYPIEVIQADRWSRANPKVTGKALEDAMQKQPWDASVKSLTGFPNVLRMMSDKLDWTQRLGDAFLAQQEDLLLAVQNLRARAEEKGNLKSTEQQKVTKTSSGSQTYYAIEPQNPDVVYVPTYDPTQVYGSWPYPDYPPYYWYPPGYVSGPGIWWGSGIVAGGILWGIIRWNNRPDINIDVNRFNKFNRTNIANGNWSHQVAHRKGVPYANQRINDKYRGKGQGDAAAKREQFRGRAEAGRAELKGGGGQAAREAIGKKPGQLPANKARPAARPQPTAFNKTGSGNRARVESARGKSSRAASANRAAPRGSAGRGGGGPRAGGGGRGGGGARGGGGRGGGGRGGGGRRSDFLLKHDVFYLGRLSNGLGYYRFAYDGSNKLYVGVMAQEAIEVAPEAVEHDSMGYLSVDYAKIGIPFETYDNWVAAGSHLPKLHK